MDLNEAKKTVPSNVIEFAKETGWNQIGDEIKEGNCSYYPVGVYYEGSPCETGLPSYIKVENGELSIFSGFLSV